MQQSGAQQIKYIDLMLQVVQDITKFAPILPSFKQLQPYTSVPLIVLQINMKT